MIMCPRCNRKTKVIGSFPGFRHRKCLFCDFAGVTREVWEEADLAKAKAQKMEREDWLEVRRRTDAATPPPPPTRSSQAEMDAEYTRLTGHPVPTQEDEAYTAYVMADGMMNRVAWILAGKPAYDEKPDIK